MGLESSFGARKDQRRSFDKKLNSAQASSKGGGFMKHTGGCHCGKMKFEVEMSVEKALSCNCSICMKRGSLLDFVPEAQFTLLSGDGQFNDYQFNKKRIHHTFCKTCGILPFAKASAPDGTKMIAINLRCIDGVDLSKLKIQEYDGRNT